MSNNEEIEFASASPIEEEAAAAIDTSSPVVLSAPAERWPFSAAAAARTLLRSLVLTTVDAREGGRLRCDAKLDRLVAEAEAVEAAVV